MISSFKTYLIEEDRVVFFTFGRLNPPTIGHGLVMDKLQKVSGGNPYRIYVSQSQDNKKNPLDYKSKIKYIRKIFPRHSRSIILNNKIQNVFDVAVSLYDEGFRSITMVVGEDRINEFELLLKKYNGKKARHGFYHFNSINVISSGNRDPDSEGISGVSASKQRAAASDNDFTTFAQGLPNNVSNDDAKGLFNAVRSGLGLKEAKKFHREIELEPVSETRERYVSGSLFKVDDRVKIITTGERGKIDYLGANYVIVETAGGKKSRRWLNDVVALTPGTSKSINEVKNILKGIRSGI